ncbi:MAG: PilZ domain-containing protein [Bacteriovoracaceae bacterium]|nr:PilZ domain-containing protein [Bacteriovoracaceae bacterium]
MDRHLNLIKTDYQETEKRVFPRFPFTYLTFKSKEADSRVFEVKDISANGMQLCLKDGGHDFIPGTEIDGTLHWKGATLEALGNVKWVRGQQLGVAFVLSSVFEKDVKNFLSVENIVAGMRPIHSSGLDIEMPANLKYWLRADGPVEIFVWHHNDGEVSRFQIILMDRFLEWEDGKGLKTGNVADKKDLDTPLVKEDEFVFRFDESVDEDIVIFAQSVVKELPDDYLPDSAREFLKTKLGL